MYSSHSNVDKALVYLMYLTELLDDIPSLGWEGVRAAHGEVLRQIEQGRLLWDDHPARTLAINKALRRKLSVNQPVR